MNILLLICLLSASACFCKPSDGFPYEAEDYSYVQAVDGLLKDERLEDSYAKSEEQFVADPQNSGDLKNLLPSSSESLDLRQAEEQSGDWGTQENCRKEMSGL
ncbi:uncharacterized protein LOC129771458 [Toxorhynchites rutilus septentrionalis]|uniref:uncharacterized protein LOC129771458 n=1 Tax=Toxorhynchites rutilus septentrionalis TaxID=329112 RepID=UPI002478DD67|nr:uncharacterized protein LOC129771458 [Toxorhynchites rutilus septentrionalis]